MRPAQLTPENTRRGEAFRPRASYFNEAGAINAGKPLEEVSRKEKAPDTSMRPAQLTPENGSWRSCGS